MAKEKKIQNGSVKLGPTDISGTDKYPEFEFRKVAKRNFEESKYQGYAAVTKEEFPELVVGYNDSVKTAEGPTYLTYRDVIWMYRPMEIRDSRRQAKREATDQQTILNNGLPRKYVEMAGGDLNKAMEIINSLPAGVKPGSTVKIPKGEAS